MKVLLIAAVGAAALALSSGATAALAPASGPLGMVAAPVVQELNRDEAAQLGVPQRLLPGSVVVGSTSAVGPCGACIETCWVVTSFHTGDNTATGSYWENSQPVWCGNGSWITYADISRHWLSVSMWYSADGEAGPWFDGGCVGCASIHYTVYGYVSWHPPIGPVSHTTMRLGVWLQAYGAASYA